MDTSGYHVFDLEDIELHLEVSDLNMETTFQQSFRKAEAVPFPYNFHELSDAFNAWKHDFY